MGANWQLEFSTPIAFTMDGKGRELRTLEDARGLLETHDASQARPDLCQAAVTAVTKAAESGQPSDARLAREQMRVLLQSLNWI